MSARNGNSKGMGIIKLYFKLPFKQRLALGHEFMSTAQTGECREKQRGSKNRKCAMLSFFACLMHTLNDFSLWMNTSLHKIQITQLSTDGGRECGKRNRRKEMELRRLN